MLIFLRFGIFSFSADDAPLVYIWDTRYLNPKKNYQLSTLTGIAIIFPETTERDIKYYATLIPFFSGSQQSLYQWKYIHKSPLHPLFFSNCCVRLNYFHSVILLHLRFLTYYVISCVVRDNLCMPNNETWRNIYQKSLFFSLLLLFLFWANFSLAYIHMCVYTHRIFKYIHLVSGFSVLLASRVKNRAHPVGNSSIPLSLLLRLYLGIGALVVVYIVKS